MCFQFGNSSNRGMSKQYPLTVIIGSTSTIAITSTITITITITTIITIIC